MKKVLTIALLFTASSTFTPPIKMPSLEILIQRLSEAGQEHFNQRTNLAGNLADKELEPIEVFLNLEYACRDYCKDLRRYMPDEMLLRSVALVSENKLFILQVLLQDYPVAIQELEGIYQ